MRFKLEIHKVQHIVQLSLDLNLDACKLTCIVGKNGVGKTTLVRAIRNLSRSDTFIQTASPRIFSEDSRISYEVGDEKIRFTYMRKTRTLDCRDRISKCARELCATELPAPHGERFHFFQRVSNADNDIRWHLSAGNYGKPQELIDYLNAIYRSDRFDRLVKTDFRGHTYYCILQDDGWYIREDYLSSGEYFLISLYRTITGPARLVVVDEIDISLDAAAQVKLLEQLRSLCRTYKRNILFTTHSLAMMRTLTGDELLYMEDVGQETVLTPRPYSYIKATLFGFSGWDRYILTEDIKLHDFLKHLIRYKCADPFFRVKIIHIGGHKQVVDLLRRNQYEQFLSAGTNVVAILDGDAKDNNYSQTGVVFFVPFKSVEKAIYELHETPDFPWPIAGAKNFTSVKDFYNYLQQKKRVSDVKIFEYLCARYEAEISPLVSILDRFLSLPPTVGQGTDDSRDFGSENK